MLVVKKLLYGKFIYIAIQNTALHMRYRTEIQTDRTRQRIRNTFSILLSLTESYYIPH